MNLPTIITMFYNIRKIENIESESVKNVNHYYNLASEFILLLPYPIIIFIDPDNIELENLDNQHRISIAKKAIFLLNRLRISLHHRFFACKGTHQHQQR